jgi:hypothetical protein
MFLFDGRAGEPASRRRGFPLVVLELVGTLAAHAFAVIPRAGMLAPWMTTLRAFAQLPEPTGSLSTLCTPCQEAAHEFEDASIRILTWLMVKVSWGLTG